MNALVLSGGGAYGAYEVGVVQALFEKQVLGAIEVVTGTSVGAFNAALLAAHGGGPGAVARLHDVWLHRIAAASPGAGNGVLRIRGNLLDLLRPADLLGRPAQSAARLA